MSNSMKVSLDRYLTSPPDCDVDSFCEAVIEALTDDFYEKYYEDADLLGTDIEILAFEQLMYRDLNPSISAKVFESFIESLEKAGIEPFDYKYKFKDGLRVKEGIDNKVEAILLLAIDKEEQSENKEEV